MPMPRVYKGTESPMTQDHRRRAYGLTEEAYAGMYDAQQGRCAICNEFSDKALQVDHDHETGRVRALLCGPCNAGLGMFKDRVRLLAAAIVYLEDHGKAYYE